MQPFVRHSGTIAVLNQINIDTDQIIPKQFLKRIERTGFGQFLFFDWRFDESGAPRADFPLNQTRFNGATILVAGANFGCGSSREHAPWALQDYGFRVIIAPSFADIFYNNCFKNGILPVQLRETEVAELMELASGETPITLSVDLGTQRIEGPDGHTYSFTVDPFRRECLLNGWDDIGLTLRQEDAITRYEDRSPLQEWVQPPSD